MPSSARCSHDRFCIIRVRWGHRVIVCTVCDTESAFPATWRYAVTGVVIDADRTAQRPQEGHEGRSAVDTP